MKQDTTPKAVEDCHKLMLWFIPQLDKFPRNRRFTLGERIETNILLVLELLTEAAYTANKRTLLQQANNKIAILRHLWRLCYELKVIAHKQYQYGSKLLVELGMQIGGWTKSLERNR